MSEDIEAKLKQELDEIGQESNIGRLVEKAKTCAYELGVWSGMKRVAENMRSESGMAYARHEDMLAKMLRDNSEAAMREVVAARNRYDKYHKVIDDAVSRRIEQLEKDGTHGTP